MSRRPRVPLLSLVAAPLGCAIWACAVIADLPQGRLDPDASVGGSNGGTDAGSGGNSGVSKYAALVLADNPVGYWRLGDKKSDPKALDSSPHARHGDYFGGPQAEQLGAIVGDNDTAVMFENPSGVAVGDLFDFAQNESFTIEAWIKPTIDGNMFIGGKLDWDEAAGTHNGWFMTSNTGAVVNAFREPDAGYAGGGVFVLNQFSHVAIAYDGTYLSAYHNGQKVGSNPVSALIPDHSMPFRIGLGDNWVGFTGVIDEVAVYDQAIGGRMLDHYEVGVGLR